MHPRLLPTLILAATALLPSCAYMQTHKNVRELGQSYHGYQLEKPRQIFRSHHTWYVTASPASFRQHHDVVHDNVFRKTDEPTMELLKRTDTPAYHAISPHTAAVLLRPDGYVDNATLAREIREDGTPWCDALPGASTHAVKAQVAGAEHEAVTSTPTPADVPAGYRVLSALDLAFVDVPGTIIYNAAVPFVAPFMFFYEFLNDR